MPDASSILIIDRGDLPSLAATVLYPEPDRLILWHPMETDAAAERRRRASEAKVEALGARRLIASEPLSLGLPDMPPPIEMYQAAMLLQAAAIAGQLKCGRIIWPRQVGPDVERMAEVVDRAHVVADLAGGGGSRSGPVIDLPLVDLTDEHLVDLIDEAGGPLELFWPCDDGGASPCGNCRGCARWREAFEAMGVPWPWAAVPA